MQFSLVLYLCKYEFIKNLNGAILINKGIVNIANCELANNQGLYDIDLYGGYYWGSYCRCWRQFDVL